MFQRALQGTGVDRNAAGAVDATAIEKNPFVPAVDLSLIPTVPLDRTCTAARAGRNRTCSTPPNQRCTVWLPRERIPCGWYLSRRYDVLARRTAHLTIHG